MEKKYLGIDCGSVGVKFALINEVEDVVKTLYLRNSGIYETIKNGLETIIDDDTNICAAGTTGSGRSFCSALIGADFVKTEILAHTLGTLKFYPDVKTILDIGGEDCKIISVKDGIMENFAMNSICGAGTGSFIDSIANRLSIKIEDVGDLAMQYKHKVNFPGKCGVFAQSSVVSRLNKGYDKSDILKGVIDALVSNYLMLGKGINLQPKYVYQGATSQNKAIVKSLEEQLNHEVIVPEHAPYMGAIGIALYAKRNMRNGTRFKGHVDSTIKTKSFNSSGCENNCEITLIYDNNKVVGCIGNRCDKCYTKGI